VHLLLDNAAHDSTGGQATVSPHISFAGIAAACGYALALEGDEPGLVDRLFEAPAVSGVRFGCLLTRPGSPDGLPRPSVTPVEVQTRLGLHIGARSDVPSQAAQPAVSLPGAH